MEKTEKPQQSQQGSQNNPLGKPIGRKKERQQAFQFIYEMMMNNEEEEANFPEYMKKYDLNEADYPYVTLLLKAFLRNKDDVDDAIRKNLKQWKLERVSKVDLAILKTAVSEMLYMKEISPNIIINEAVDLAKIFSGEKSHQFVNGVLRNVFDSLYQVQEQGGESKS